MEGTPKCGKATFLEGGFFAEWEGHPSGEKWYSPREAPSRSGRDNPIGIMGVPRGGSLLGSKRNYLRGKRGAPWGGAPLGVEGISWWGEGFP